MRGKLLFGSLKVAFLSSSGEMEAEQGESFGSGEGRREEKVERTFGVWLDARGKESALLLEWPEASDAESWTPRPAVNRCRGGRRRLSG